MGLEQADRLVAPSATGPDRFGTVRRPEPPSWRIRALRAGVAVVALAACGSGEPGNVVVSAESPSTPGQPPPTQGFPPGEPPEPGAERISRDVAIAQSEDAVTRFSPVGPVRIKSAEELPYADVARRFGPQGPGNDALAWRRTDRCGWFSSTGSSRSRCPQGMSP
jgi:hypothetical protein